MSGGSSLSVLCGLFIRGPNIKILKGCDGQAPSGHLNAVKNIHSEHPSTDYALKRCTNYKSRPAYYLRLRTLRKKMCTAHPPFALQTDVGFAHSRRPGKRTTSRKEASQILNGCDNQAPSGHLNVVKNIHSEHPGTDYALKRRTNYM